MASIGITTLTLFVIALNRGLNNHRIFKDPRRQRCWILRENVKKCVLEVISCNSYCTVTNHTVLMFLIQTGVWKISRAFGTGINPVGQLRFPKGSGYALPF